MPAFVRWVQSTCKDSTVIIEKHIFQMSSLSFLRAWVQVTSHQQIILLTLVTQWMGPQLKIRKTPSVTYPVFQVPLCKST